MNTIMAIVAKTAIDFVYPAFLLILGIVMIFSPRTLMRKAKYDEESMKTESWVKRLGIVLCIAGVAVGIYYFYKMNNA